MIWKVIKVPTQRRVERNESVELVDFLYVDFSTCKIFTKFGLG